MPGATTSNLLYIVYILERSKDSQRYVGLATNLRRRPALPTAGQVSATKSRLPLRLVSLEGCTNSEDVKRRERYLKTTRGRRFPPQRLKAYIRSKL